MSDISPSPNSNRSNMTSSESDLNDVKAASTVENEEDDLPSGSERELIEYFLTEVLRTVTYH